MAQIFDPTTASYLENPYPALARLRGRHPVYWWEESTCWLVSSHSLATEVLNDAERFKVDPLHVQGPDELRTRERERRQSLLGGANRLVSTDPPDHTRLREVITAAFSFRSLDELQPAIEAEVDALLDRITPGATFDLVVAVAKPLPLTVIAEQLGVAEADRITVIGGSQHVLAALNPLNDEATYRRGQRALGAIARYLDQVAKGRVAIVGGEVLARMVDAHQAKQLSSTEIVGLTIDLATAGNQAVEMAIGNAVATLLRHRDQLDELKAEPDRIRDGVDELLRYETPMQALPFVVGVDTGLGGERLEAGQKVFVLAGAANRDPEVFADPDRLDLSRQAQHHLAFGAGIHSCLGAALARRELATVLAKLLARFDEFELPARGISYESGFMHRSVTSLLMVVR